MPKISPILRMGLGLTSLSLTIILFADMFGLTPDRADVYLDARVKIVESLAIYLSKAADGGHITSIKHVLTKTVKRNEDVLSASLRMSSGQVLVESGDHRRHWTLAPGDTSTPTQIQVPIYSKKKIWGNLEIRFGPVAAKTILGYSVSQLVLLALFVCVSSFILYTLFLKRTLKYLDPSSVVPDRVRSAMDVLSEGILILDKKEQIVLANTAFLEKVGESAEALMGKTPDQLQWNTVSDKADNTILPWKQSLREGKTVSDVPLSLFTQKHGRRAFLVNSTPITGGNGKIRGALTTFNDVTQLQKRNTQLKTVITNLKVSQKEVKKKNKELAVLAAKDPLTGCLNRRSFYMIAEKEFLEAKQDKSSIACIMADIDHFKKVNDVYGHKVGDEVIRRISAAFKSALRQGDHVCRYGGEEFCFLINNATADQAKVLANRIRKAVADLDFSDNPDTKDIKITSSFGVSDTQYASSSLSDFIDQADQALYLAKESGRNRVALWKEALLAKESQQNKSTGKVPSKEPDQSMQSGEYRHISKPGREGMTKRMVFLDKIRQAITYHETHHTEFVVLMIDIDMFKRINNTLGHKIGDQLLKEINQRLTKLFRASDSTILLEENKTKEPISLLGGDEFGILIKNISDITYLNQIATRLNEAISEVYVIDGHHIKITSSIGISTYPAQATTPDDLLRNSEIAMYNAKEHGGNVHKLYEKEIDTLSIEELELENDLYDALKNNEFLLHYQPKVDLHTGEICGVEALVRWQHPTLGMIPPGQFIPIVEKTGLIIDLGFWVLQEACRQTKVWMDMGYKNLRVAVNLSALQLRRDDFLEKAFIIIKEANFNPNNLEFEITESMVMENIELVTSILQDLSEMGIQISIDDFGTGYSSLNYIKRFPISIIKIDRSFIQNITTDPDDEAIVAAIVAMAHALKLKVVAEGVEEHEQLDFLRELLCDQIQGFFFSRPLPYEEVTELIKSNYNLFSIYQDKSKRIKASG